MLRHTVQRRSGFGLVEVVNVQPNDGANALVFTDATGDGTHITFTEASETRLALPNEPVVVAGFVNAGFNGTFTVVSDDGVHLVVLSAYVHATETHAGTGTIAAGNKFFNNGQTLLKVVNGANPTTITVTSVPCSHGRTKDAVFATLANKEYYLGPFGTELFNDANGDLNFTCDQNSATTVAALDNT